MLSICAHWSRRRRRLAAEQRRRRRMESRLPVPETEITATGAASTLTPPPPILLFCLGGRICVSCLLHVVCSTEILNQELLDCLCPVCVGLVGSQVSFMLTESRCFPFVPTGQHVVAQLVSLIRTNTLQEYFRLLMRIG